MNQEPTQAEAKRVEMRPVIFNSSMVRAILAGRKTQTRRIIKPQPVDNREIDGNFFEGNHKGYVKIDGHPNWKKQFAYEFCPYGKVGNILYVRETMYEHGHYYTGSFDETGEYETRFITHGQVSFAASDKKPEKCRVVPSIHMPRRHARLFLKITDISVERLKSITKEDAIAEGVRFTGFGKDQWGQQARGWHVFDVTGPDQCLGTAQSAFGNLWEKINGPDSWEQNPWIWKITFERIETPTP